MSGDKRHWLAQGAVTGDMFVYEGAPHIAVSWKDQPLMLRVIDGELRMTDPIAVQAIRFAEDGAKMVWLAGSTIVQCVNAVVYYRIAGQPPAPFEIGSMFLYDNTPHVVFGYKGRPAGVIEFTNDGAGVADVPPLKDAQPIEPIIRWRPREAFPVPPKFMEDPNVVR